MNTIKCPERLWDYGIRQLAEMRQVIPRESSKEKTPMEFFIGAEVWLMGTATK